MTVLGPWYLVAAASVALLAQVLRTTVHRRLALSAFTLLFLGAVLPDPASAGLLLGFTLLGFVAGAWQRRRPSRVGIALYLVVVLAAFAWLQRAGAAVFGPPAEALTGALPRIGLGFVLLRQIHYVVDAWQGQLPQAPLGAYLHYQLNPLTLVAGPLVRFQAFLRDWRRLEPVPRSHLELLLAVFRILLGLVLGLGVAPLLFEQYERALAHPEWDPLQRGLVAFYAYPLAFCAGFAGVTRVAIGFGALAGLSIPENFDRAWTARNVIDFWNRWHRTLTHWLHDYLLLPLHRWFALRLPRRERELDPLCLFVTFVAAGLWHGLAWNFLAFGLLHATGAAAAKAWESRILRRSGRPGLQRYLDARPLAAVAVFATLHFVALSLHLLSAPLPECLRVARALLSGGAL